MLSSDTGIGNFKGELRHGSGKCTWSDGSTYEGDWVDGEMTGKGLFIYSSGDKYEGEFFRNCRHGNGTQTWKDEGSHIGNWKNDKKRWKRDSNFG